MKKVLAMLAIVAALAACAGAMALEKGVFDYLKLKNWTDEAIEAACGVDGASFRPSNPQPLTYIVTCAPVIDPLTGAESEGGWERDHRIYPADTNRVLNNCSNLSGFSLTLTDDPNLATFRAYITFTYKKGGTFNYRDKGAKIPKYDGVMTVKLVNLLTGESATMSQDCWCFYAGEGVRVSALDEGIGRQFYAGPTGLTAAGITPFSELLGLELDALYNYEDDGSGGVIITDYMGDESNTLTVPDVIHGKPVTGIGERAFADENFTRVVLPETVTHLDARAFSDCSGLTDINFPASLTSIGEEAFCQTGFREVALPDSVTGLGAGAFSGCFDLKSIRLPSGLKVLPSSLLSKCGFTAFDVPEGIEEIGRGAFSGCRSLKKVVLPQSVRVIGENAFWSCYELTEVTCLGEIGRVESRAFCECGELTDIRFQGGVREACKEAFTRCAKLSTLDLTGIESLGDFAFNWCPALTRVILPETLTQIGKNPFGEHGSGPQFMTFYIPEALELTVVQGSFAEQWAVEQGIPHTSVTPPTEEELLARRYPPMKKGSKGEEVRRLQQALIERGFLEGTADGSYGPRTAAAVSAAQEALGLPPDGEASAAFQAKLYGK